MAHNIRVPEDSEWVLALKITEDTIWLFRTLTNSRPGRKLKDDTLIGNVIIVPVDTEASWGWMTLEQFEETYAAVENWSKTKFTLCTLRDND